MTNMHAVNTNDESYIAMTTEKGDVIMIEAKSIYENSDYEI